MAGRAGRAGPVETMSPPAPRSPADVVHDAEGVRLVFRALLFDGSSVPTWHDHAACADRPRSLFFPETDGQHPRPSSVRAAKAVCGRCPVRATCLEDVMTHESRWYRHGVVGGLSPAERHRLHRRATVGATS
jgi:WhiB family redox-sensing transcriptional regulator